MASAPPPPDIIHSAPATPPGPLSARSRRFIFSPRADFPKTPASLRRLLPSSPRARAPFAPAPPATDDDDDDASVSDIPDLDFEDVRESDESSVRPFLPPARRRRHWLDRACLCFAPRRPVDDQIERLNAEQAARLRALAPTYEPQSPLLPSLPPHAKERICLVLDLDETLVHSSFDPFPTGADFSVPLEMPGDKHTVYVKKRPFVDEFLAKCSQWYEVVVFTASLALYANPVMDVLDPTNHVQLRLYREHCVLIGGCYVKDMRKLGRDLKRVFIVDNSPLSYVLQPENAIPISSWYDDENDRELEKTLARLEQAKNLRDVRQAFR